MCSSSSYIHILVRYNRLCILHANIHLFPAQSRQRPGRHHAFRVRHRRFTSRFVHNSHNAKVIIPDYQPFIRPINLNMLMLSGKYFSTRDVRVFVAVAHGHVLHMAARIHETQNTSTIGTISSATTHKPPDHSSLSITAPFPSQITRFTVSYAKISFSIRLTTERRIFAAYHSLFLSLSLYLCAWRFVVRRLRRRFAGDWFLGRDRVFVENRATRKQRTRGIMNVHKFHTVSDIVCDFSLFLVLSIGLWLCPLASCLRSGPNILASARPCTLHRRAC